MFSNMLTLLNNVSIYFLYFLYLQAKGGGPKPMIDNPNASATKQSSLIKPLALKVSSPPSSKDAFVLQQCCTQELTTVLSRSL